MDKVAILPLLPTEAPSSIREFTYENYLQELGGHMAIYKRVSYCEGPELQALMCPDDWDSYYKRRKPTWAAECTCTCCHETWHTAWAGGPLKDIVVLVGEDGISYPIHDLEDPDAAPYLVQLSSNDGTLCPICGEGVTLMHASRIKSGSTRRIALCTIENVEQYTALMYWLAYRHIDSDGCVYDEISPWYAYLIDERGKLVRFRYSRNGWRWTSDRGDPFHVKYVSGGDIYNFRRGGFVRNEVPSLIGFTGEKTGLGEYVRQGGQHPLLYIKTWARKPAIENLITAGWSPLLESLLDEETHDGELEIGEARLLDINWDSRKPHEMLRMDRVAFRHLDPSQNDRRRKEWLRMWHRYRSMGGALDACEFDRCYCHFTCIWRFRKRTEKPNWLRPWVCITW